MSDHYGKVRRDGLRIYTAAIQANTDPYLPVLENKVPNLAQLSRLSLGVMTIPLDRVVGSVSQGRAYAFTENFVLPLSHDEIVHGKGPLLDKMPGDKWQKFANLRAYFGFMYTHPGKKLLFMGDEFAQDKEWKYDDSLAWHLVEAKEHKGIQRLVSDLNHLIQKEPALYENDCDPAGFDWIDGSDIQHSVIAFMRFDAKKKETLIVCCNFTPATLHNYRLGAPYAGTYKEIFNSNSQYYGGTNTGNKGAVTSENIPYHGKPYSVNLLLPPLSTIILKYQGKAHAV